MAICFYLLQVLTQKHTTASVFDKAIKKSTHCVLKQAELQISTRIPRVV